MDLPTGEIPIIKNNEVDPPTPTDRSHEDGMPDLRQPMDCYFEVVVPSPAIDDRDVVPETTAHILSLLMTAVACAGYLMATANFVYGGMPVSRYLLVTMVTAGVLLAGPARKYFGLLWRGDRFASSKPKKKRGGR